jgi:DNA-binding response OmpR family regulator
LVCPRTGYVDELDWTAWVAPDAAAARAIVRAIPISLLLLDLHLPGISGLVLLALLRQDPAWTDPPPQAWWWRLLRGKSD